jgi:hypothetical protein
MCRAASPFTACTWIAGITTNPATNTIAEAIKNIANAIASFY